MAESTSDVIPRVGLVIPYYGRWPSWMGVWLKSCAGNPWVTWLVVTDLDCSGVEWPSNVRVVRMGLGEIRERAESMLGQRVALESPYKLCDFRPLYGFLFQDLLGEFEYWGYSDMDVVWGDLLKFFPPGVLRGYDRLQNRGHLSLYRNTEGVNRAFQLLEYGFDYREILKNPRPYAFDEWGGIHQLLYCGGFKQGEVFGYADIYSLRKRFEVIHARNYPRQLFFWEEGRVFRQYLDERQYRETGNFATAAVSEELMYVHLQKRSMPAPDPDVLKGRGFYITPDGFMPKRKLVHHPTDYYRLNAGSVWYRLPQHLRDSWRDRLRMSMEWSRRFLPDSR